MNNRHQMRKILEQCPSCGSDVHITEVRCESCDTRVQAKYRPCDFCRLTDEQATFLRIFVGSRGNLTEVEKRLGVSYPTVRAKLDEIVGRLGDGGGRRSILEAVARGDLKPDDAARRLRNEEG
ncbi:MAG: DUF2089 domain-containing protein [Chloroflexota bacterium]|nr:MAG: DUF2089 domain-containing protein [Chloroflexota bacterium]